jgi:hypothetical protein
MSIDEKRASAAAFEQRSRAMLQRSVAGASPQLRARIARVRQQALDEAHGDERMHAAWLPAAALGTLAAIAIVVQMAPMEPEIAAQGAMAAVTAADTALLLNADNLDLLERMEFYLWLESEPGALDEAARSHRRESRF